MLPEPLRTGDYELYEVAAPYGYVLSSEPVPFTIDGSEAVVTVTQYNMPQKGQLTITKTGEVFASVQENDGLYQPVYEVMGLPGAVYDVIADEDIYTGDGTLRAAKDTVAETLTTGEDGTAQSGLLYLGALPSGGTPGAGGDGLKHPAGICGAYLCGGDRGSDADRGWSV